MKTKVLEFLKKYWFVAVGLFIVAFLLGRISNGPTENIHNHSAEESQNVTIWTCSMHPQIRQPEPGKCPICAMDLIPVEQEHADEDLSDVQLRLSDKAIQLAQVQTAKVEYKSVNSEINLFGKIQVDETRQKSITSWVAGRIEKLFVDYTGATVKQGDPLVEIYSPDLFVAQQEYLDARSSNNPLVDLSTIRKKLELLGLSSEQIDEIEQRGKATEYLTIKAPIGGVVLTKNIQQGDYVKTGMPLYDIADLSTVWIYLDAYEKDLANIKAGQKLTFTVKAYPGESFSGQINFVEPILNKSTRTVKVRATASNKNGKLSPELLVNATINSTQKVKELVVPASAPLQTGKRAVVYIALGEGKFEGRQVTLGPRYGDHYAVLDGLAEGDQVVVNGNFKIDSEMQIRAKPSMMNPEGESMAGGHQHHAGKVGPSKTESSVSNKNENSDKSSSIMQNNSQMSSQMSVPAAFLTQLDDVYQSYFKVQKAFSHDKLEDAHQPATELTHLIQSVKGDLGAHQAHFDMLVQKAEKAATRISKETNFAIARAEFKNLSDALIDITKTFGASGNITLKQLHCPMAFNNSGANWLQDFDDVENPYFGSQMFSCGSVDTTFVEADKGGKK